MNFSLSDYCDALRSTTTGQENEWHHLHESSQNFLKALDLPSTHPFCMDENMEFPASNVPPMGPMWSDDHHETALDVLVTVVFQAFPALWAMGELWLRLFASALAPLGVCHLMWSEVSKRKQLVVDPAACLLSVASSVVLMTDTYYVLQYGPLYGATLLCASTLLSFRASDRHGWKRIKKAVLMLLLIAVYLISFPAQFGGPNVPDTIQEGLYYSSNNNLSLAHKIAQEWPESSRTYSVENGATPWMPTGDSRTGLPFLLNFWHNPEWTRVYLTTVDEEVVALDICFPPGGHNPTKSVYMILHGLNGGSEEEYIKDLVHRRSEEGHTMVVMVARGLMDLPVKGWNVFHGARVDDAHTTAKALRRGLAENQLLVGVGYSMGAIVMSNYVARSGVDCALDAAMAVSGGLDMRHELHFGRAKRLWQPMLVTDLRQKFILGKFGERYRHRLSQKQMLELMRAVHVSDVDDQAVVTYNGFNNITHYYSEMSALGDIPLEHLHHSNDYNVGRIANISVPFCVLHALDDPLITWRTVASKEGMMHPDNLVQMGSGHLMLLLTKAGGHVGWPLGWFPHLKKWKWMSDAVKGYMDAVAQVKSS